MARSNCLIFAVRQWLRYPRSYIAFRKSDRYFGPHILWGRRYRDGRIKFVSFVPPDDAKDGWFWPIFEGHLARGDKPKR